MVRGEKHARISAWSRCKGPEVETHQASSETSMWPERLEQSEPRGSQEKPDRRREQLSLDLAAIVRLLLRARRSQGRLVFGYHEVT